MGETMSENFELISYECSENASPELCADFEIALRDHFPEFEIQSGEISEERHHVFLEVLSENDTNATMRLHWVSRNGIKVVGEAASYVVSDRKADEVTRLRFMNLLLMHLPLPGTETAAE